MDDFLMIARALSDQSRVRALMALKNRQLCVCQIMELLAFAPSTVSKHLTILKQAGLVKSQKRGRWVFYRLAGKEAPEVVKEALRWLDHALGQSRLIQEDAENLRDIVRPNRSIIRQNHRNQ